jgi:Fe-S oxidoreductase
MPSAEFKLAVPAVERLFNIYLSNFLRICGMEFGLSVTSKYILYYARHMIHDSNPTVTVCGELTDTLGKEVQNHPELL